MDAKDKVKNRTQATLFADRVASGKISPSNSFEQISATQTASQNKTSEVVPSTGGSDEMLPKPYKSSMNNQTATMLPV